MTPRSSEPSYEQLLHITRGESAEIYRIRLRGDGAAQLERFENGTFRDARTFTGDGADEGFDAARSNGPRKLERAVRYVTAYLDGATNIGERDLLSPTSALARNVRWFPGDIQMINTAFHYVHELFPSAQFHVTQLFRRVFGDVAFLSLMVATSAHWLKTTSPVGLKGLAVALQVLAIVAIVGFDRLWEPIRHRFRKEAMVLRDGSSFRLFLLAPFIVVTQLIAGIFSAALATLIGLSNLAINPLRIFESWRQVSRGKALEWKASSVSAGQDMRGWPLDEFRDVYRPATISGVVIGLFGTWLIVLGAPLELLGVNGLGVFVVSFLTAALYAWYAALPHAEDTGAPQYRISRKETTVLVLWGALGVGVSWFCLRRGLYPLPAFEGSVGYIAMFLTLSAVLALAYPAYYSAKFALIARGGGNAGRKGLQVALGVAVVALTAWLFRPSSPQHGFLEPVLSTFRIDETRWRMPRAEQEVYTKVGTILRSHGKIDPEPLLKAEDQATLASTSPAAALDLQELSGIPPRRLPRLAKLGTLGSPEFHPLPERERILAALPARQSLLPATPSPLPARAAERREPALDGTAQLAVDVAKDWTLAYPNVPFAALGQGDAFEPVARFLLETGMSREELALHLRLDYVDAHWNAPSAGASLQRVFANRARTEAWEDVAPDWTKAPAFEARWRELQTEQAVATRIWAGARGGTPSPKPSELRRVAERTDALLSALLSSAESDTSVSTLEDVLALEGVDAVTLRKGDAAALLQARLWTPGMPGRVGRALSKAAADVAPDLIPSDRELVQSIARARLGEPVADPDGVSSLFREWLLLADGIESYRELATGYDRFARETRDRGVELPGLKKAPALGDQEILRALLTVWKQIPTRYPNIPVRDDMVAEFLVQAAYLSSHDGRTPRDPARFVDDFDALFRTTNALVAEEPPAAVQRLVDAQFAKARGRKSRSDAARRFLAWWTCAEEARVIAYESERRRRPRTVSVRAVASDFSELLVEADRRWPHLPWFVPGFGDRFLEVMNAEGWGQGELWARFGKQLGAADALAARHITPSTGFETLIDRRSVEKRGAPNFDPALRRANAWMALGQLQDVARSNGVTRFDGNPALLTEQFTALQERLKRAFPALGWDGEGLAEYLFLMQQRNGWTLDQTVERFRPEWTLASRMATSGLLARFDAAALQPPSALSPPARPLRVFVDTVSERLLERTGLAPDGPRNAAMTALVAAASLVLAAGEEGLIPDQHDEKWSQERVRKWAASLPPRPLAEETSAWALALASDFGSLVGEMRQAGPRFPWQSGFIVETTLLASRNARASVADTVRALAPTWKAASDLVERESPIPEAFQKLVQEGAEGELRTKLAAARGVMADRVLDADVAAEDPALSALNAKLVLADLVAEVRRKYGEDPDAAALADRFTEIRTRGPQLYPHVPFAARGFAASFLGASYAPDFRADLWKYAAFIDLTRVDALLGDFEARSPGARAELLPASVVEDVRATLKRKTGRLPRTDDVVFFQTFQDGVFLLKEFQNDVPLTLENVTTIARLREGVRQSSRDYPELHIAETGADDPRVGFAERLASIAMKDAIRGGHQTTDDDFVTSALAGLEGKFLGTMNKIYELVRASFPPEELEYYRQTIHDQARIDNVRRAQRYGLSINALSVPEVQDDDVVADLAMYEILYATEMGKDQPYLVEVFRLFDVIRSRPENLAAFHDGLARIDAAYAPRLKQPSEPGYGRWLGDPDYVKYWEERGRFIKKARGRIIALARTFALVQELGFSPSADPAARASFARFGKFDDYVGSLLGDMERVRAIPDLSRALSKLDGEDPYLSDGVLFAFALFKTHVVNRAYPGEAERMRVASGIAGSLPGVEADYSAIMGMVPRIESGVSLHDARIAFLRNDVHDGGGTALFRRLGFVQRSVHEWPERYVLKHAYNVLFHVDLDEDDPAKNAVVNEEGGSSWTSAARRLWPRTRGDDVKDFLDTKLPSLLQAETGGRDLDAWIDWLAKNGEIGLDGKPTGRNPHAEDVASFESRIAHYQGVVDAGIAEGKNVRGEEQRLRDIRQEYASLERQVSWLHDDARTITGITGSARASYHVAVARQGAGMLLLGIVSSVLAFGSFKKAGPRLGSAARSAGRVALALVFAAGVLLPCLFVIRPLQTARFAGPALSVLGLAEAGEGGTMRARGATLQLQKSRPWEALSR